MFLNVFRATGQRECKFKWCKLQSNTENTNTKAIHKLGVNKIEIPGGNGSYLYTGRGPYECAGRRGVFGLGAT